MLIKSGWSNESLKDLVSYSVSNYQKTCLEDFLYIFQSLANYKVKPSLSEKINKLLFKIS